MDNITLNGLTNNNLKAILSHSQCTEDLKNQIIDIIENNNPNTI